MRDLYPRHGKRWTLRHPFRWVCRCGLDSYPCPVVRMQQREQAEIRKALDAAEEGLVAERPREERRRRPDGLR